MERIEETYPQLAAVQDAYRLTAGGRTAVAEAYAAFREFPGPLITSIAAQMLPDLRRDAAGGRHVVFVGRDGHGFAAATRALDPEFFNAQCHEVVPSRVVAEAALQDLEVHRGARFPEVEGFRGTRNRVAPQDVPGAFRRLTAYPRTAGAIDRLRKAHRNAIMIHTPVRASWLNQVEIFFSIIQKKVVTPNDFASTTELSQTLLAFADRYSLTARPFNWKFTADDLTALLRRISEREQKPAITRPPADLALAA